MTRLWAGAARRSLPPPDPRAEMLGWGLPEARCARVHTPLAVRALVLSEGGGTAPIVLVVHEQCMASHAVRAAVLARLQARFPEAGFCTHRLVLGANHTHAAPGGYLHELFYTLGNPGFDPVWFEALVEATVAAVGTAWSRRAPASLALGRGRFRDDVPVAVNRAPEAFARNRTRQPAVERGTTVLTVRHADGTPLASVDWFGVHGTCVHADQKVVHPDNKGMAARALEAHAAGAWGAPDFVALYLQGAAGDVSPNTRLDRDRGLKVGHLPDDFAHADWHGRLQADVTRAAWEADLRPLEGPLDGALHYLDFDGLPVDADLADGRPRRTAHGLVGLAFLLGTDEGPGPLRPGRRLSHWMGRLRSASRHRRGQGGKLPFCEVGRGRRGVAFGALRMSPPAVPGLDPVVDAVDRLTSAGGIGDAPWIANRQPVQVLRIGPLGVVCVAGEPTTHAGRLLARTAARGLAAAGVDHVVVCGYANAFSGYLTTAAEYALQDYEGGHTLYGPWTLAGWRTGVRRATARLAVPAAERPTDVGLPPEAVPADVLAARSFPC